MKAVADQNGAFLMGHGVGTVDARHDIKTGAVRAPPCGGLANQDQCFAVGRARPPEVILIMAAQRRRQSVGRTVEIERCRLAIVPRQDRGSRELGRRQCVLGTGDRLFQRAPAELIGE
jgi:hypothetical protein